MSEGWITAENKQHICTQRASFCVRRCNMTHLWLQSQARLTQAVRHWCLPQQTCQESHAVNARNLGIDLLLKVTPKAGKLEEHSLTEFLMLLTIIVCRKNGTTVGKCYVRKVVEKGFDYNSC